MMTSVGIYTNAASAANTINQEALNIVADFADRICKNIPLEGTGSDLELSGNAKAELSGLINKIADLGIEGAAKYNSSKYQGLLQKDLATVLKNSMDCKLEVFKSLKDGLFITHPIAPSEPRSLSGNDNLKFPLPVECEGDTAWADCRVRINNTYDKKQHFRVLDAYLLSDINQYRFVQLKVIDDPTQIGSEEISIPSFSSINLKLTFKNISEKISSIKLEILNLTLAKKTSLNLKVKWVQ